MNEFATTVRARALSARQSVWSARAIGDQELTAPHEADLRNLERLVREHGVDVGGEPEC